MSWCQEGAGGPLLLATGSSDTSIRIWKFQTESGGGAQPPTQSIAPDDAPPAAPSEGLVRRPKGGFSERLKRHAFALGGGDTGASGAAMAMEVHTSCRAR